MALNAVCNERLLKPELLLQNLIRTVGFILEVNNKRHTLFSPSPSSGGCGWLFLNKVHDRVKGILKHGAKIKHHLIYAQSSFAGFDTWLEGRLLDYSLPEELLSNRGDITELYYEWAFIRDPKLFDLFIHTLYILGTRDFDKFCELELNAERLVQEALLKMEIETGVEVVEDAPLPHLPLVNSPTKVVTLSDQVTKDLSATSNSNDALLSHPAEEEDRSTKGEVPAACSSSTSSLKIPDFSYALISPICSPAENSSVNLNIREEEEGDEGGDDVPVLCSTPLLQFQEKEKDTDDDTSSVFSFASSLSRFGAREGKKSFLESGGFLQPPAFGHFPLPQKGQSLTSFLSSLSDPTYAMPELDRENAHFNVSEALISAFEQLRVARTRKPSSSPSTSNLTSPVEETPSKTEDEFGTTVELELQASTSSSSTHPVYLKAENLPEPDEPRKFYQTKYFPRPPIMHTETEESEVEYWRHRLQRRKKEVHFRKKLRVVKGEALSKRLGSDGMSGTATAEEEEEASSPNNPSSSSSSSYSSFEDEIMSSSFSAENVALKLLRNAKMKEEHLPPASELKWLVSENETPQSLLPLPKNWERRTSTGGTSDLEGDIDGSQVRLRGSVEWAPPRPQIIFMIHPPPSTRILTEKQRYRCAGCGMRVDPKYMSAFRYCYYLGRYFCTGCHKGKTSRLPQYILHRWDFSPYPVSNFSSQLLEHLYSDPVYNALAINPNLTRKVKLNNFRNYRIQLSFLNEYLKNCKSAQSMYEDFLKFPTYYTADVDLCSLEDLINVRFSTGLPMILKDFVTEAIRHVLQCHLCKNLGFICEICKRTEIIFPFQINRVSRCPNCSSCFHLQCYSPHASQCPKCLRVTKRRGTLEELEATAIAV